MPAGKLVVALDGPAGAGKSTVSRMLADALAFALVDTGAIYRCISLAASRRGIPLDADDRLADLVNVVDIRFDMRGGVNHVLLNGEDVTEAIRTPENSMASSKVSARRVVRDGLLGLQRRLALSAPQPGAVLEGRDIGTVVFPDAEVKVFLEASVDERARRRHRELVAKGSAPSFEEVRQDIIHRDKQDRERDAAPLRKADDARLLDSTHHTAEQMVEKIAGWVRELASA